MTLKIKTAEDKVAEALAKAREDARRRVYQMVDAAGEARVSIYPAAERATWPTQIEAAKAVLGGTATVEQESLLGARCAETGETIDELAEAIVANANALSDIGLRLSGIRAFALAAIEAAPGIPEIQAALTAAQAKIEGLP